MESDWNPVKDFQMGSWWNPGSILMEFPSNPGEDFSIVGLVLLPPPPLSSLPGGCFSRSGLTWNAPQFSDNHWPLHPPVPLKSSHWRSQFDKETVIHLHLHWPYQRLVKGPWINQAWVRPFLKGLVLRRWPSFHKNQRRNWLWNLDQLSFIYS